MGVLYPMNCRHLIGSPRDISTGSFLMISICLRATQVGSVSSDHNVALSRLPSWSSLFLCPRSSEGFITDICLLVAMASIHPGTGILCGCVMGLVRSPLIPCNRPDSILTSGTLVVHLRFYLGWGGCSLTECMLCHRGPSFAYSPMVGESKDVVGGLVLTCATSPRFNWDSAVMVGLFLVFRTILLE